MNFKEIQDKANSNSLLEFYEETDKKNDKLFLNKLWIDSEFIPEDLTNISFDDSNIYSIHINETKYPILKKYKNEKLYKRIGTKATFETFESHLKDCIPYDFGNGYDIVLTDSNNLEIPFGLNRWFIDYNNGTLTFDAGIPSGYTQPFYISFVKYVGRTGTSLLKADGSIELDDGYVPYNNGSIVTKSYLDNKIESISQSLSDLRPDIPDTFENKDIYFDSSRKMKANFILSNKEYDISFEGDNIIFTSDYFYNEENGTISLLIGNDIEFNNESNDGLLYLNKDIEIGQYNQYWTVLDNKDAYEGTLYKGHYNIIKLQFTLPWSDIKTLYSDELPFLSFRLKYNSVNKIYLSKDITIGFESVVDEVSITEINMDLPSGVDYKSGVPSPRAGSLIKLEGKVANLKRFYSNKFIHISIPDILEKDLLPNNGAFDYDVKYNTVNPIYNIGFFFEIPKEVYNPEVSIIITTYDIFGNENGQNIQDFNFIIDTKSFIKRCSSGYGEIPETAGLDYLETNSLVNNNELQQLSDFICFPNTDYSDNGKRKKQDLQEPNLHEYILTNSVLGPSYTDLEDIYRYITFRYEIKQYINAFYINLNGMQKIYNSKSMTLNNCSLQCKIIEEDGSKSGWINCNSPYNGCSIPYKDNDSAMVANKSTENKKYITFGSVPRKGILFIRFGMKKSDATINSITLEEII